MEKNNAGIDEESKAGTIKETRESNNYERSNRNTPKQKSYSFALFFTRLLVFQLSYGGGSSNYDHAILEHLVSHNNCIHTDSANRVE